MSNNLDDFDDDFADATVQRPGPGTRPGMAKNLAAAWQGSPLFKLFVLVVGVGALAAAVIGILSGNNAENKKRNVNLTSVPGISAIPGEKAPPAYIDAVNQASAKRAEDALLKDRSAMPTPISGDSTTSGLNPEAEQSNYDPLAEFRPNVPQDVGMAQPGGVQDTGPATDPDALGKMQTQMTSLFDSWRPEGIKLVQVADAASLNKPEPQPAAAPAPNAKVIVPAGTIAYAQLITEANSDAPGPILAEIMSGPFTGGRAIGKFQVTREYLIMQFTKVTYKKKDYPVDALALDPNTTLGGLVTEKDNRYFTRVLLPSAAAFLEGFGSALSSPSSTTTVTNNGPVIVEQSNQGVKDGLYKGLSESARTVGGFLRDEAQATQPLIRVAVGTPMGLFFINTVTDANGGAPIQTPVQPAIQQNQQPPLLAPNPYPQGPALISPYSNGGGNPLIMGGSQSSLANSGLSVIQNTK